MQTRVSTVTSENSKKIGVLLKISRALDRPFTRTISYKRLARADYNCLTLLLLPSRMSPETTSLTPTIAPHLRQRASILTSCRKNPNLKSEESELVTGTSQIRLLVSNTKIPRDKKTHVNLNSTSPATYLRTSVALVFLNC